MGDKMGDKQVFDKKKRLFTHSQMSEKPGFKPFMPSTGIEPARFPTRT